MVELAGSLCMLGIRRGSHFVAVVLVISLLRRWLRDAGMAASTSPSGRWVGSYCWLHFAFGRPLLVFLVLSSCCGLCVAATVAVAIPVGLALLFVPLPLSPPFLSPPTLLSLPLLSPSFFASPLPAPLLLRPDQATSPILNRSQPLHTPRRGRWVCLAVLKRDNQSPKDRRPRTSSPRCPRFVAAPLADVDAVICPRRLFPSSVRSSRSSSSARAGWPLPSMMPPAAS